LEEWCTFDLSNKRNKTHAMKKYIVYAADGSFVIAAKNYADAISIGRRQCRLEKVKFESIRLVK
jgi:hypothetical protein